MQDPLRGAVLTFLAVAAYGAFHSLLASPWAKRAAQSAFGETGRRGYRLAFNLVSIVTLLPVLTVPALHPGTLLYRIPWPWAALPIAVQAASLAALAIGLVQTDPWHFLGLRQLTRGEAAKPRLIVDGLYRWVRHPLYTAGLAFIWFTPWMSTSVLALNLALTAYIYIGSGLEEQRLLTEFGEAYRTYARQTPRLLPRLRRPSLPPRTY
jgi:protein-S-isoprenylcysteine O-methyltransferase Ste14